MEQRARAIRVQAYPIQIDKTALGVMEQTLDLNNEACIESALHGLGHFVLNHPRRAANIIKRFLDKQPDLRREFGRVRAQGPNRYCFVTPCRVRQRAPQARRRRGSYESG